MNIKSNIFILGLVARIYAANFSVVSFNGNCEVKSGGQSFPMKQEPGIPLYKTTADIPIKSTYQYVCNGVADVERVLNEDTTHNELIGRALTVYDMPEFGYPNAEPWKRSIGRTELFDPDFVPIIVIDSDKQFFSGRNSGVNSFAGMHFILKDNFFSFNNVPVGGKNYDENKFQFKITLPGEGIYHRTVLKFRPSSYDPVFFRQILYGDIAHAIGNPVHESVAVRVYLSDGTGIGLYVLQEDCTSESFIRTAFFGDEKTQSVKQYTPNVIYDCATGADFTAEDGKFLGAFKNNTYDLKIELLEMTQRLGALNVLDVDAVKEFDDNELDLDTLFRALALEYLAGHWDSYWFLSTNFVTYHPEDAEGRYKFYFIDQDFDQTWGVGMYPGLDPQQYPHKTYNNYINVNWKQLNQNEFDTETRVIVDKLIGCDGQPTCITKQLFEDHLKSIVQHIFNPVAMERKTNGYKARLTEEMQWDLSLERLYIAANSQYQFTMDDFIYNIDSGNYLGSKFFYGILDWTKAICDTVCNQFDIEYDKVAYTPETAAAASKNTKPIDPGTEYDPESNLNVDESGSDMTIANVLFAMLAAFFSLAVFFL